MHMTVTAAKYVKRLNSTVTIAVVTNANPFEFDSSPFDIIIPIRAEHMFHSQTVPLRRDKHERQWLTRLYYLAATPFQVTFALDSNIQPCRDIAPVLEAAALAEFDIAVASQWSRTNVTGLVSHNFALLYRWSPIMPRLFARWLRLQLALDPGQDDQHTLTSAMGALRRSEGLRVRKIANSVATAMHSVEGPFGSFFPRESRLIDGHVTLLHLDPGPAAEQACRAANAGGGSRRVLYQASRNDSRLRVLTSPRGYAESTRGLSFGWPWRAPAMAPLMSDPYGGEPYGWL